jgi:hypothetical protein
MEDIRAVHSAEHDPYAEADLRPGASPPADEDIIVLKSGETLRGSALAFREEDVIFDQDGEQQHVRWGAIRLVTLADLQRRPPPVGVMVELADSSLLAATRLEWSGDRLEITLSSGQSVQLDPRLVAGIEVHSPRRLWLAEIAPQAVEHTAFLDRNWTHRVNRCAAGGPLVVNGRTYRRGLGLHSACKLTWELGGRFQSFVAAVGIDDSAGPWADADLRVCLDGKLAAEHRGLMHGQKPRPIKLDVSGRRFLTIEVGYGRRGHVQDRVDVLDAALIRPAD